LKEVQHCEESLEYRRCDKKADYESITADEFPEGAHSPLNGCRCLYSAGEDRPRIRGHSSIVSKLRDL
jgi:hypothetical protein